MPYTDALLKNNNFSPKYDKGSDVYDSCVSLINSALTILKDPATAATISTSNDNASIITFKGSLPDLSKWIKFGNSLKLRLLINQSEATSKAAFIKNEAATIDPSMLLGIGDDVTADPGYIASSGKLSPYSNLFFSAPGQALDPYKIYHANNYALDFYNGTNDPRLSYYYDEDGSGNYSGTSILPVYNDYRRTGFPKVPISIYPGHLPNVPLRLIYPQSEYNLNAANVGTQGSINPQTDKVFWDQ